MWGGTERNEAIKTIRAIADKTRLISILRCWTARMGLKKPEWA
jgi:hypothetical protein